MSFGIEEVSISAKYDGERLASRLKGYDYADALRDTDKSKYTTEHEYMNAVTETYLKHTDPTYSRAYKGIQAEIDAQRRAEQEKNRAQRMEELKRTTQLDNLDKKNIDRESRRLAEAELRCGAIAYSDLADRIKYHGEALSKKMLSEKVNNILCNEVLRGQI